MYLEIQFWSLHSLAVAKESFAAYNNVKLGLLISVHLVILLQETGSIFMVLTINLPSSPLQAQHFQYCCRRGQ